MKVFWINTSELHLYKYCWSECLTFTINALGTVAGVYVGMEYGVERIRGTRDWVFIL